MDQMVHVVDFDQLGMSDLAEVGGKNAALGEMISQMSRAGLQVPEGFATLVSAYRNFMRCNGLEQRIDDLISGLETDNVLMLRQVGEKIRELILKASLPDAFEQSIRRAFSDLENRMPKGATVAVRSSATAEDLPDASFAGQQETFLNVQGIDQVMEAIKKVFASLYNDRAISYRAHQGFNEEQIGISAGIQRMVRSDLACSGVMFTVDTETGFPDAILITASYGLGEMVVQGAVNPDEFYVYKPNIHAGLEAVIRRRLGSKQKRMIYADVDQNATVSVENVPEAQARKFCLDEQDILTLARYALIIENHYGKPMDIEWGKDGIDGQIYILQARPETVVSRFSQRVIERYQLQSTGHLLTSGRAIGQRIASGIARIVDSPDQMDQVQAGEVLVADMTDPDWEPVMKKVSAIITDRGGRTCHAAIIARELGISAIVGCGDATKIIRNGQHVTVCCAEGDTGNVYEGALPFDVRRADLKQMPPAPVRLMMNVANPEMAFNFSMLPNDGVGLARMEFVINRNIGIHPKALLEFDQQSPELQSAILERISGYGNPIDFYIGRLAEGIATIGAAFAPKPVIVRMSDFKTNEYANMLGGAQYEPNEENPMIGFRGASRYLKAEFESCFELECQALRRVREEMGMEHIQIMVPFVRTLDEARGVIELLAKYGLRRGEKNLKLIMMCEVPSNAILADEFLDFFDGFSIGSNDLTQLTLGLDRDSGIVSHLFDERDPAVKKMLHMAISACRRRDKYIGICGQGPSDHPDLARWLLQEGISSISLNPDSVLETWLFLDKNP